MTSQGRSLRADWCWWIQRGGLRSIEGSALHNGSQGCGNDSCAPLRAAIGDVGPGAPPWCWRLIGRWPQALAGPRARVQGTPRPWRPCLLEKLRRGRPAQGPQGLSCLRNPRLPRPQALGQGDRLCPSLRPLRCPRLAWRQRQVNGSLNGRRNSRDRRRGLHPDPARRLRPGPPRLQLRQKWRRLPDRGPTRSLRPAVICKARCWRC
jgi:hypothetical protein